MTTSSSVSFTARSINNVKRPVPSRTTELYRIAAIQVSPQCVTVNTDTDSSSQVDQCTINALPRLRIPHLRLPLRKLRSQVHRVVPRGVLAFLLTQFLLGYLWRSWLAYREPVMFKPAVTTTTSAVVSRYPHSPISVPVHHSLCPTHTTPIQSRVS